VPWKLESSYGDEGGYSYGYRSDRGAGITLHSRNAHLTNPSGEKSPCWPETFHTDDEDVVHHTQRFQCRYTLSRTMLGKYDGSLAIKTIFINGDSTMIMACGDTASHMRENTVTAAKRTITITATRTTTEDCTSTTFWRTLPDRPTVTITTAPRRLSTTIGDTVYIVPATTTITLTASTTSTSTVMVTVTIRTCTGS
jgi:hypothetical protein